MRPHLYILAIATMMLASCQKQEQPKRHVTKADLIEYNRQLVKRDSAFIARYCQENGLDSVPTKQGLWISIEEDGEGEQLKRGDKVDLAYQISDITGKIYYTSEHDGLKHISIGSGQDIMALDIALPNMRHGTKATLIVMPDLAYGLMGDDNKIGARRILRYDIEVLK